MKSHINTC